MISTIRKILEMIRFSHTLFALPFALLAAVMAWCAPVNGAAAGPVGAAVRFQWRDLIAILVCMVCARSAAMAFNRIVDRHTDAQNPRTLNRHLPTGDLTLPSVIVFTVAACLGFVAGTCLFLPNRLPLLLALPVLAILLGYSYAKRFTALAHFWLGAALMLAPVCAWIAIRGEILMSHPIDILPAFLLGAAVLVWVAGFDIIYACQDVEFDRIAKLHSVPTLLGVPTALRLAAACHAVMILVLIALPLLNSHLPLGWIYWIGLASVAGLLVYEHVLVSADDLRRVNVAFFQVNAIVSIGLFAVGALDLIT